MFKITAECKSARFSEYHTNKFAKEGEKAFLCILQMYSLNGTPCNFLTELCVYTNYDVVETVNGIHFANYLQVVSPLQRTKEEIEKEIINPIDVSFISEGRSQLVLTALKVEPKLNKDGIWSKSHEGIPFMKVIKPYIVSEFLLDNEVVA
jgi:hypothetical protein